MHPRSDLLSSSSPSLSQISLTVIGASDGLMIPVEASVKGLQSLIRTLELINELKEEDETFGGRVLGVVPFRDLLPSSSASYRWVGLRRTTESESNIESMKQITTQWFEKDLVLPSIRESEKFKQAINRGLTLHEMGQEDLAYPIEVLSRWA
jgi:chromosome partitioning protein